MGSKKHDVPDALLASLLADYKKPEDLIGENGLLKQLTTFQVEKERVRDQRQRPLMSGPSGRGRVF